jgi:hypothetical protein
MIRCSGILSDANTAVGGGKEGRYTLRVCLDGERISVRIVLFGLVVENSVRLVISREI